MCALSSNQLLFSCTGQVGLHACRAISRQSRRETGHAARSLGIGPTVNCATGEYHQLIVKQTAIPFGARMLNVGNNCGNSEHLLTLFDIFLKEGLCVDVHSIDGNSISLSALRKDTCPGYLSAKRH